MNEKLLDRIVRHADEYDKLRKKAGLLSISTDCIGGASKIQIFSDRFAEMFPDYAESERTEEYVEIEAKYAGRTFFCITRKEESK